MFLLGTNPKNCLYNQFPPKISNDLFSRMFSSLALASKEADRIRISGYIQGLFHFLSQPMRVFDLIHYLTIQRNRKHSRLDKFYIYITSEYQYKVAVDNINIMCELSWQLSAQYKSRKRKHTKYGILNTIFLKSGDIFSHFLLAYSHIRIFTAPERIRWD